MTTTTTKNQKSQGHSMLGCSQSHQMVVMRMITRLLKKFPHLADHVLTDCNIIEKKGTRGKRYPDVSV